MKLSKGFTIVELIVVIVVISILAAVTLVSYGAINNKAVIASIQSDLSSGANKLKMYQVENSTFPTDITNDGNGNYCPVPADARYCFRLSSANELEVFYGTQSTFKLIIANSNTRYQITENSAPSAATGDVTYLRTFGGSSSDTAYDFIQTSDGEYVVAGIYRTTNNEFMLSRYTSDGRVKWMKTWGTTGYRGAVSLVQSDDGGFIVSGYSDPNGAILSKYTYDGNLVWMKSWGGSTHDEGGDTVIITSDGGYAVSGYTTSFGMGAHEIHLEKYTSDGTLSWNKTYGGTNWDNSMQILQADDGGYYIVGDTRSYGAGNWDSLIIKVTSGGTISWVKTWGSTDNDWITSFVPTEDGGFVVAGITYGFGNPSGAMYLARYTSNGTLVWNKIYSGAAAHNVSSIVNTNDGGYAVTGYTSSFGAGGTDMFISKLTEDGTLNWTKTWGGTASDYGNEIIQTPDGGYAILGSTSSYGAGSSDGFIAKLDPNGLFTNCSSPMCQSASPTTSIPSATETSPTLTTTTPSATIATLSPTLYSRTPTTSVIVYP